MDVGVSQQAQALQPLECADGIGKRGNGGGIDFPTAATGAVMLSNDSVNSNRASGDGGGLYDIGAVVALFIVGLANVRLPMPGRRFQQVVRGLAGTSFGLYLLHYPFLNFFGTLVPGPPEDNLHRVLVFALALSGALGLASLIEPRKAGLKSQLRSALHLILGKPPPTPAAARQRLS